MSTSNSISPVNLQKSIQGIILRTSAAFNGRYAYLSLPHGLPTAISSASLDAIFDNSLTTAPHFPEITILDCISCDILYQAHNFSDFFHVYNLIGRIHFPIPFPYPHAFVNAAITVHERIHFKILVACIQENSNPLFEDLGDGNSYKQLLFYVYSSKSKNWSCIRSPSFIFNSKQLLTNRRKPAHAGEDVVYLDLTSLFLIRFASLNDQLHQTPKNIAPWEGDSIDETTRYAGCKGLLHCVKFNPIKVRFEVYVWTMELSIGFWRLEVIGVLEAARRRVLGLHPNAASLVFVRSEANDAILMVDIRNNFQWVVAVAKRGENCGQVRLLEGMTKLLKPALEDDKKLKASACDVLHPHENADGPEGEIFIVSLFGDQSDLQ